MKPERRHTANALVRATTADRAGAKGGKRITGYAAVFDSPTDIGPFTEEIAVALSIPTSASASITG